MTALIVARIIKPVSKLATAQALQEETAKSSLAIELQLGEVQADELYEVLDWLKERQKRIENKLAKKHLQDSTLLLYDVSGSYYTGRRSKLVQFGHPRDGKSRFPQIIYGLLCNAEGCPISIEVFPGNTGDPNTLSAQVEKIRKRFGVRRVVIVGDRGMITSKRIDKELRDVDGLDWITALRADSIKKLASKQVIQPSLFDERDLVEVSSPDYPGERLIVCRNPFLCMLAYYVEWHMRQKLRSILFDDHEREAAEAMRKSIVSPAPRSMAARAKDATKRTKDDYPVESFRSLLDDLGTLAKNRVRIRGTDAEFYELTQPTPLQQHVFDLLGVTHL